MVPQFLAQSFEMFRDSQSKWVENMSAMNPMAKMPGFEAMQAQQEAFMKAMTGAWTAPGKMGAGPGAAETPGETKPEGTDEDLDQIKAQLADLQAKLNKLGK